jgi:hypothetical protein
MYKVYKGDNQGTLIAAAIAILLQFIAIRIFGSQKYFMPAFVRSKKSH